MTRRINPDNYQFFCPDEEEVFPLRRPPAELRVGGRVLESCAQRGRTGRSGEVVRLKVCRLPLGLGTSVQEYRRFIAALNEE